MKDNRLRYLLALIVLAFVCGLFALGRIGMHPIHFWNRILADGSLVLIALTMIIGPAAHFFPRLQPLLPWRRELGVVSALAAVTHVLIYLRSFNWNPLGFFFRLRGNETRLYRDAFGSSNWIGLLALVYILVLGITANDFSQKWLGRGWKFLQQQNYTLFALVFIHTLLFIYLVYPRTLGIIKPAFWVITLVTFLSQLAGYIRTVWLNARRRKLIP